MRALLLARTRRDGRSAARLLGAAWLGAALAFAGSAGAELDLGALARGRSGALPSVVREHASSIVEVPFGVDPPSGFVRVSTTETGAALGVLEVGPERLLELAASRPELGVSWSPPLRLLLDRADGWNRASAFRNATGLTGKGVVLGIVDTGIDPTHPDLMDAHGKRRILWWLDFSLERAGRHPELEDALGCRTDPDDTDRAPCAVFDARDLDELLGDGDPTNDPRDFAGHGTHVASLAGGSGHSTDPPVYVGVAPEASYVVARVARKGGGIYDSDVLRAASFVFERAEERGMPAVVNLSLGTDFGGHDGTTPVERGLSSMVGSAHPGRAVVVAAGNSAGLYTGLGTGAPEPLGVHTEVHVGDGASTLVPIITPATSSGVTEGTVYVWLTLRAGDDLALGVENRAGTLVEPVPRGSEVIHGDAGVEVTIINGVTLPGSPIPAGSYGAAVVIDGRWSQSEVFGLRLEGPASARIWLEGGGALSPERGVGPLLPRALKEGTINVPASAPGLIAVGATLNRTDWPDHAGETVAITAFGALANAPLDTVAYFSSAGPNALGVLKPDLVAPGANVVGAMASGADPRAGGVGGLFDDGGACRQLGYADHCFVVDDLHGVTGGTSMSAPLVTGAVALLLEHDPTLDQEAIRALLQAGARPLEGIVTVSAQVGAGALDLERTLQALEQGDVLRTPGRGTLLVLSESYAHPDPTWPLQGLIALRDDAGAIVDGFDPARLALVTSEVTVTRALARVAPGLWRFELAAQAGTGGRSMHVAVTFDGRTVKQATLPIAVDKALAGTLPSARGGCALVRGGAPRGAGGSLAALLGFGVAAALCGRRARRSRSGTARSGAA